jgi:hypothetical protein
MIGTKVPYLSTSEGGPQIGQPNESPLTDAVVENSQFFGTGDDAIVAFDTSRNDSAPSGAAVVTAM